MSFECLEEARTSYGTDEDVIFVFSAKTPPSVTEREPLVANSVNGGGGGVTCHLQEDDVAL